MSMVKTRRNRSTARAKRAALRVLNAKRGRKPHVPKCAECEGDVGAHVCEDRLCVDCRQWLTGLY